MARVLVAEDEPGIRNLICAVLEEEGHEVMASPDGDRALEQILDAKPDLAILDMMMPGLTGDQVVKRMDEAGMDHTPVIYISAVPLPAKLESRPPAAFLSKPFELRVFLQTVSQLVHP